MFLNCLSGCVLRRKRGVAERFCRVVGGSAGVAERFCRAVGGSAGVAEWFCRAVGGSGGVAERFCRAVGGSGGVAEWSCRAVGAQAVWQKGSATPGKRPGAAGERVKKRGGRASAWSRVFPCNARNLCRRPRRADHPLNYLLEIITASPAPMLPMPPGRGRAPRFHLELEKDAADMGVDRARPSVRMHAISGFCLPSPIQPQHFALTRGQGNAGGESWTAMGKIGVADFLADLFGGCKSKKKKSEK